MKTNNFSCPSLRAISTGLLGCMMAGVVCPHGIAQAGTAQSSPDQLRGDAQSATSLQAPRIDIGPGDQLSVDVFDTPELSQSVRVNQSGEVNLSVIGTIRLAGMTANQASRAIEQELRSKGLMIDPHVSVSIMEYASQGATLMGEVRNPGIYPTLGSRKLLDMVALGGGPTALAGKTISIIHRDDPADPVNIPLAGNPAALSAQLNPVIQPGDTIVIAKAGIVYILGAVNKPGGFLIDNNEHITLLQSMTLAGGWTATAATSRVHLIRKVPQGREDIKLDLKHVTDGKEGDLKVLDGDIVFIPSSFGKTLGYRGLEALITAAQTAAIYTANQ